MLLLFFPVGARIRGWSEKMFNKARVPKTEKITAPPILRHKTGNVKEMKKKQCTYTRIPPPPFETRSGTMFIQRKMGEVKVEVGMDIKRQQIPV